MSESHCKSIKSIAPLASDMAADPHPSDSAEVG